MTQAEILHRRKIQLKNEIVKPLLTLIDKGLDVPGILQDLTREAPAGNGALTVISVDRVGTK